MHTVLAALAAKQQDNNSGGFFFSFVVGGVLVLLGLIGVPRDNKTRIANAVIGVTVIVATLLMMKQGG